MALRTPIGKPILYNSLIYRWFSVGETSAAVGPPTLELVAYSTEDGGEEWTSGPVDARASVWDGWNTWIYDSEGIRTYAAWPGSTQDGNLELAEGPNTILAGDLFIVDSLHGVVIAWDLANEEEAWRIDTSTTEELEFFRILNVTEDRLICGCLRQTLQDCEYHHLQALTWESFPVYWDQEADTPGTHQETDTLQDIAEGHSVKHLITSHSLETGALIAEYLVEEDTENTVCGNAEWNERVVRDESLKNPNLTADVHVSGWWTGTDGTTSEVIPGGAAQYKEHCQHPYYTTVSGFTVQGANAAISATLEDGEFLSRVSIMEKLEGLLVVSDYDPFRSLTAYPGDLNLRFDTFVESHVQWLANTSRPLDPNDRRRWVNLRCSSEAPHPKESTDWGPINNETYGYVNAQRRASQLIFGGDYLDYYPLVTDWTATLNDEDVQSVNASLGPPTHNWAVPFFSVTNTNEWISDLGLEPSDLLNFHVLANRTLYGIYRTPGGFYTFTRSIEGFFEPYSNAVSGDKIVFGPARRTGTATSGKWLCLNTDDMTVEWERDVGDDGVFSNAPVIVGTQVITVVGSSSVSPKIVALDLADGTIVREVDAPNFPDPETQPAITSGKYWFGADDKLYSIDLETPEEE